MDPTSSAHEAARPVRVAVASGKGGTGKTLVSTNLAWMLARGGGSTVTYVDTDVEAPNGHLYLHPTWQRETRFTVEVPALRTPTCSGCTACQQACAFSAIIALPQSVMVFPELCHSCGGCVLACEEGALHTVDREVGTLRSGRSGRLDVWDAVLDVGEAKAPPLIDGLLDTVDRRGAAGPRVVDAPPGTSCSAITVVRQADHVLLVTEPTPFGLHDLKLAVAMCRAVGRPVSVVINRSDLGDDAVRRWLDKEGLPVLAEIPFSTDIARCYAEGTLAAAEVAPFRRALEPVVRTLWEVPR